MKRRFNIFSPPPLGTVLFLPGLPGAGTIIYDRSLYGNHGTITGATWKFNGRVWYLDFDGTDDYVDCGLNVASLELTTFTFCGWINPTTTTTYKYLFTIADLVDLRTGWGINVQKSNDATNPNKLAFNTSGAGGVIEVYGNAVTYGSWQFVAVTFNATGQVGIIYQDVAGVLTAVTTSSGTLPVPLYTGDNRVVLGALWGSTPIYGYNYKGSAVLINISSGVQTLAQLNNIKQQTKSLFGV